MDITAISLISTATLILTCLFLIIYPIFRNDLQFKQKTVNQELHDQKAALMIGLNEIEFEHKTNKISEQDFINIKKQYERELVKIIKEEEKMLIEEDIDKDILQEVEKEIEEAISAFKSNLQEEEK